jgi:hypothetical protein
MTLEKNQDSAAEQSAAPQPEMVDLHEADRLSVKTALDNAIAEEAAAAESGEAEQGESTPPTVTGESEAKPKGQPAANAGQPNASQQTGAGVVTQGADTSKPAGQFSPEELQGVLAENERLKKQGTEKELFIQRRSTELGALRAQHAATRRELEAAKAQLATGLNDRFSENPLQATEDRDRIQAINAQIAEVDHQDGRAQRIVEAQTFFLRNVDTEKVGPEDIADMLKADGIDDRYVAEFKANPWEWTTPEALVQMGKRAFERKELVQADTDRRLLARYALDLKAEVERLKGKPRQVVKDIQKNLNRPQQVTPASTATPAGARTSGPHSNEQRAAKPSVGPSAA